MSSWPLSPQAAAKELLRRRNARNYLIDYSRYTYPGYVPSNHHFLIADALERVAGGEIKRLMINMPPRHGKSELATRRFPAYFLGKNPEKSIISASYNNDLSMDFGRDVRNIMRSDEHTMLFPNVSLASDSTAAGRWHTSSGGGYVAAGVGTAITGRGAHLLIIDDPLKDRAEADSANIREKVYNWYLSTAYTRLESELKEIDPDPLWSSPQEAIDDGAIPFEGAVIIIQTRWHEDDLSGRLLLDQENGADQWEVLNLPAINDKGEALWSNKYSIEKLIEIKSALTNREWQALYQQEPTTDEGDLFKRDWFSRYNLGEQPSNTHKYLSSDFGVTKDGGDYTEFGIFDVDADSNIYITDWWYGQETSDIWVKKKISMCREHSVLTAFGETGVIRRAVEPLINAECEYQNHYPHIEWITRTGDKVAMSRVFQGLCSQGKVYIPNTEWGDRLINQLTKFPNAKNDDAVDVCTLFGLALDSIIGATRPPRESERVRDYYEDEDEGLDNWKTA